MEKHDSFFILDHYYESFVWLSHTYLSLRLQNSKALANALLLKLYRAFAYMQKNANKKD